MYGSPTRPPEDSRPVAHLPTLRSVTPERDRGKGWRFAHFLGLVRDPADQPAVGTRRWWIDMAVIVVIIIMAVVVGSRFIH
jgi:hypothetical protein